MKFNNVTNNFSAGEWSPKMRARTEVQQYFQACESMENFLPKIYGGAFRRPGTIRVNLNDATLTSYLQNALHNTNVKSKMIPRVLSTGTKQFLIATDSSPSTWIVVDATNPSSGAVQVGSVSTGANFTVTAASIKYVQQGDVVILVDGTGATQPRIWIDKTYTGGKLMTLAEYVTEVAPTAASTGLKLWEVFPFLAPKGSTDGFLSIQTLSTVGTTIAAGTTVTVNMNYDRIFTPDCVGMYFKLNSGGKTGVIRITSYTSSIYADAYVEEEISSTGVFSGDNVYWYGYHDGTSYEEPAWSPVRGWPKTVTAFEQRLVYGANSFRPDTIWGSRIGNFFAMMERPFEQDDAFTGYTDDNSRPYTLAVSSRESTNIRALSSAKTLMIHTDRSEIVAYGTQGALGPNDVTFDSSTSFGANPVMPVRVNNYALFVQKGGRKVRDLIFNFEQDQYKSSDLSFTSDHLTLDPEGSAVDPIVELVAQTADSSYVWAKTQNGRLLVLAIDRDYQVNAWAPVKLGGSSELKTFPLVKSICAIETNNAGEGDRMYFIVQRRINGANVVQLEYLDRPYEFEEMQAGSAYLQNYLHMDHKSQYIKNAANRSSSLDHLKGETVQAVADGELLGEYVVDGSGEIGIDSKYTDGVTYNVIVGLKTTATLKPMPIELGQQVPNSPQGFVKRIDQILIKFFLSRGCKYGYKESDLLSFDFSEFDNSSELFTGIKEVRFPSDYTRECQVIIKTDLPWPCNVLSVISKGMTYD